MAVRENARPGAGVAWWLGRGVAGGLIAGLVFAAFEMLAAAVMMGPDAAFMPLRMIGAIALGSGALDPAYDLVTAALTGVVVHLLLSAIFGAIFALVVATVPALARSSAVLVAAASVYGLLLWLVNFYVIAPAAGWDWFPTQADPVVQFLAHTFFYGSALGLILSAAPAPRRAGAVS